MKGFKVGGFKSSSSLPSTRTEAPRPSTSTHASARPAGRQNTLRDGFDAPRGTTSTRSLFGAPAQQRPQDVTSQFTSNPMNFAGHNVLNAYNMTPSTGLHGVALPTPHQPFVPAHQSVATLNVHQHQGNANLSVTPPGGQGAQVHYLHYLSEGEGRFAGISGVPLHPQAGQPNMVVTGPLNGCAVHALHNSNDNTLSFLHHANYSEEHGPQQLQGLLAQHPHLRPVGSFTPGNYSHDTGSSGIHTGATSFLHYNKPPGQAQGQWMLLGQLNDWQGVGPGGRPQLVRPENLPAPFMHTLPLNTEQ